MNEPKDPAESTLPPIARVEATAGSLLRGAREAQGMELSALADLLKVNPRKLAALEADERAELRGVTFERALAQAVCRALKLDPAPVLARLPRAELQTLDEVNGGLNAPFRQHGSKLDVGDDRGRRRLFLIAVGVLVLAAAVLWGLPKEGEPWQWMTRHGWFASAPTSSTPVAHLLALDAAASSSPVNAELGPAETPPGGIGTLASAKPPETPAPSASANRFAPMPALTTPPEGPLLLRTREPSWIEVTDAAGKSLFSRNVAPGESVSVGGELPLHVKVGNAAATDVVFRGETVDLASQSKDNVARIELK